MNRPSVKRQQSKIGNQFNQPTKQTRVTDTSMHKMKHRMEIKCMIKTLAFAAGFRAAWCMRRHIANINFAVDNSIIVCMGRNFLFVAGFQSIHIAGPCGEMLTRHHSIRSHVNCTADWNQKSALRCCISLWIVNRIRIRLVIRHIFIMKWLFMNAIYHKLTHKMNAMSVI